MKYFYLQNLIVLEMVLVQIKEYVMIQLAPVFVMLALKGLLVFVKVILEKSLIIYRVLDCNCPFSRFIMSWRAKPL